MTAINLEFKDGDDGSNFGNMISLVIEVLDDQSYVLTECYDEDDYKCSFGSKKELIKYLGEIL